MVAIASARSGPLVGATRGTQSSPVFRAASRSGSASSIGRSTTKSPSIPAASARSQSDASPMARMGL